MENPKEYDVIKSKNPKFSSVYETSAEFLVKNINWKDGDVIMDYGCGSGHFSSKYLSTVGKSLKIYGIDISSTMIDFATANYSSDSAEFSVGNIMDQESWTFLPESVDKFVSYLVLCYVDDYQSLFKKAFEQLRPGGQMGLLVPFSKAYGIPYKLFSDPNWVEFEKAEKSRIANWVYEIENGLPNLKESMKAEGFKVLEYQVEDAPLGFASTDELCEFLSVITASASRVPEDRKQDLMSEMATLAKTYLPIEVESDQPLDVDWKFLKVIAEK